MFILSEFEITGSRTYANSTERDKQLQYDYYSNGNSKIFCSYNNSEVYPMVLLRSVMSGYNNRFCQLAGIDGTSRPTIAGSRPPNVSNGFVPCFVIG